MAFHLHKSNRFFKKIKEHEEGRKEKEDELFETIIHQTCSKESLLNEENSLKDVPKEKPEEYHYNQSSNKQFDN